MTVIAHISDPHFGTVDAPVREAILRDLHGEHVDLIVVSGDITQRARSEQFREAKEFLEQLPTVPRLVIPGNHDIPLYDIFTRIFNPYRLFRRYIGTDLDPVYSDANVAVVCVNATKPTRHKNGVLTRWQIRKAGKRLTQFTQPFKIIATHQPLAVTLPHDETNLARGATAALDNWVPAGADLFIGGHIHLPYIVPVKATTGERTAVVMQAGTAVSRRIRHGVPNSYNRITLQTIDGRKHMRLERRDYDAATETFAAKRVCNATSTEGSWTLSE